jgi:hypothetical protein
MVGSTELLDPCIDACLFKQLIEFRVKCVSVRMGQIQSSDEPVLLLNGLASTKGHLALLHGDCVDRNSVARNQTFYWAAKLF